MCTFTNLMNFPPPIFVVAYQINALLFDSYSETASDAAKDTYEKLLSKGHVQNSDDQSMDNTISGDSVWSKRAFINKWTSYINF